MYKGILLATDGSALAEKAAQTALAMARHTGAPLVALRVVPPYPRNFLEGGSPMQDGDVARIEQQWQQAAQTMLDRLQAQGQSEGVSVKAVIIQSDLIAEAIVEAAKNHDCDLIVMASHGHKGLRRLLLGSETQHVLALAHIPVLVLR